MSRNSQASEITKAILSVIDEKKPRSVKQLTAILRNSLDLEEKEIVKYILKLQTEGIIKLENQAAQSRSLAAYLRTSRLLGIG